MKTRAATAKTGSLGFGLLGIVTARGRGLFLPAYRWIGHVLNGSSASTMLGRRSESPGMCAERPPASRRGVEKLVEIDSKAAQVVDSCCRQPVRRLGDQQIS